jgi:RNA polymerase sigma-70 factor (ECF subfamily)
LEETVKNIHQDLIDSCKNGDRYAQFRIYKLYYRAMFNTCLRIVNDSAEAEDIMQDSFLDGFRKIKEYKGDGSFGSWLKRIVINNSLDALRKRRETLGLDEEMDIPEEEDNTEEEIRQQVDEIKKAIAALPDEYRIIISLYLLEGYDHEEISGILKISYNNSRTRYSRARQKLLQIIQQNRITKNTIYN